MSQSSLHATAFYKEVAAAKTLWTIRDANGFPAPLNSDGKRCQPFWSSLSRAKKIIESIEAYSAFEPVEMTWEDFCTKWVPGLQRDNILVGLNWSGPRATGYDIEPAQVLENIKAMAPT